ncbi:uncharacterized protein LOC126237340 [Schistocerca nitens]|uniref:uncharacterized protein LOC126237340 n=1 Tax=Schistocerca nitens TaxID=7011 RepID=UPI002117778F|nr:uncharacterized protein LOC126237340 [Schistocerca nitens]
MKSRYTDFCARHGVTHVTAPPFHPQSNGEAERLVCTFKAHMRKLLTSSAADDALLQFLASYRFTPMGDHSLAELLHGRQPRTLLHLLQPPTSRPRVPSLGRFTADDLVWVRGYGRRPKWSPGCILRHRGRRLYEIQTDTGVAVRHLDQLRNRVPATPVPNAATPPLALPDTRDFGISQYSQRSPLTVIAMPAPERTPPGDVPMQEPEDHRLSEQIYSPPPPPTDADTSPMSPVISTGLAATGRLVHGAPADSTPTSPAISTRYHRGHFRPYGKPPPRDFTASQPTPMDVSHLQDTSIKTSATISKAGKVL